jgi:ribosomal protein S18 acetylase RimI-like enzyme
VGGTLLVVDDLGCPECLSRSTPDPTGPLSHQSSMKGVVMHIRQFTDTDLARVVELTIDTFRPFYEEYVHPLLGDEIFQHQHGHWEQDYREDVPTLHDPEAGRYVAVGDIDGSIAGFVSWRLMDRPHHGQIYLLAVAEPYRRQNLGHRLCVHALAQLKDVGVEVVEIGTGEDDFHIAARELYESLGFTKVPIAGYLKRI